MSTSTSPDRGPQPVSGRWLAVPPLAERLEAKLLRMLPRVRDELPRGHLLLHRTTRISTPPRRFAVEFLALDVEGEHVTCTPRALTGGQASDWEHLCVDLGAASAELCARWPSRMRPETMALLTDGRSIWFSPSHPSAVGPDWIRDHLSGRDPCALIIADRDFPPLTPAWFRKSNRR